MLHWFWALKPPQYHWVFCACSLNGLCKSTELWAQFAMHTHLFHFPFETRYWRWSSYSGKWLFLLKEAISAFSICQSVWSESPTGSQCEAVIVNVPSCPTQALRFACERIQKEDVSAELIAAPPFVSLTLASAVMRRWGNDKWTIDEAEEGGFIF